MQKYKFKVIKRFNEDIFGFFARKPYKNYKSSKMSKFLSKSLRKNYSYRRLLKNNKLIFFKRKKRQKLTQRGKIF